MTTPAAEAREGTVLDLGDLGRFVVTLHQMFHKRGTSWLVIEAQTIDTDTHGDIRIRLRTTIDQELPT